MLIHKKILLLLILLSGINICAAQQHGIVFTSGTWQQALALAKANGKPIFLFGTTPWCQPCKEMVRNVFPDKVVADYFNKNFINIELNIEEPTGDSLIKQYGIATFPIYLFFDKNGALLHISGGGKPANEFIQDAKNAFVEDSAYAALKIKYDKGDRTPGLLYNYSNVLGATVALNQLQTEVEQQYLQTQDSLAMKNNQNLRYVFQHARAFDAPATKYFLQYYPELSNALGSANVKHRTTFLIVGEAENAAQKNDTAQLKALKKTLSTYTGNQAPQLQKLADVKFAMRSFVKNRSQWKGYVSATNQYAQKYISNDTYTVYEASSYLLAFGEDAKPLPAAAQLINKAIAVKKTYDYYLVLAKIYHKMGQLQNAVTAAKTAIALGADKKADTSEAKDLLAEIKKAG